MHQLVEIYYQKSPLNLIINARFLVKNLSTDRKNKEKKHSKTHKFLFLLFIKYYENYVCVLNTNGILWLNCYLNNCVHTL